MTKKEEKGISAIKNQSGSLLETTNRPTKHTHKNNKKNPTTDPYAEREASKYQNPIVSREFILDVITQASKPLSFSSLLDLLNISSDDEQQFIGIKRRIRAMVRDGQIIQTKRGAYSVVNKSAWVKGRVSANAGGFGFLIPEEEGDDLFLSSGQMQALFDGDIILASISGIDRRGRQEGRVEEIVERKTREVVGRCFYESGLRFLRPESKKIHHDILVVNSDAIETDEAQFVVLEITQQPDYRASAQGKIIEVLGEHMAPGMEIDVAIRTHQLPHRWPEEIAAELDAIPPSINAADIKKRIDLRHQNFVTIDGEDARDFDDAIFCQRNKTIDGSQTNKAAWTLSVAIADVANYVASDSALDIEAINRGNSVYFPKRVIPMLPEKLSNGLCSLNPKEDRLTLVCEMQLDAQGELLNYCFMEACIHSKARLTYTEVAKFLDEGEVSQTLEPITEDIIQFHELYQCLKQKRDQRGAINVETTESRFVFNEARKIQAVVPVIRNVAHQMIEEAMLLANICAAKMLQKNKLPALYRIHDAPGEEKLNNLKAYLLPLGFRFSKGNDIKPAHFQEVIAFSQGRADQELINTIVLRSMHQAMYSPTCSEHFGLAYDEYAHFTSPIRRYPDLIVHRALKYLIRSKRSTEQIRKVSGVKTLTQKQSLITDIDALNERAQHVSFTERRADLASRDATDWLKCEFMLDKVGEIFSGKISTVTGFGLFVLLDDIFIEGLIHITELKNDYYHYDDKRHELQAEQSKKVFKLADPITIQVARVSLDEKKIEFILLDDNGQPLENIPSNALRKPFKKASRKPIAASSRTKRSSKNSNKNEIQEKQPNRKPKKKRSASNKKSKLKKATTLQKNEKIQFKEKPKKKKTKKKKSNTKPALSCEP